MRLTIKPVGAREVIVDARKYLIFHNRYAGRRNRYDVIRLNARRPVYVGLELTLAHALRVCR